jgi:hypothetical protein
LPCAVEKYTVGTGCEHDRGAALDQVGDARWVLSETSGAIEAGAGERQRPGALVFFDGPRDHHRPL